MAIRVDIKKDPLYQEGALNKAREVVIYLLQNTNFEDDKIASIAGVKLSFVLKIRKELKGV